MKKLMITGANGFIGARLITELLTKKNYECIGTVRRLTGNEPKYIVEMGELERQTIWKRSLHNVDVAIHTAARISTEYVKREESLTQLRKTNVEATLNLARQSADAGIKRFIFISSVKVNGERTKIGHPYYADDKNNPTDPYSISKQEAEEGLLKISSQTGLEVVIIRPPLVYGPGVKGNFASMMSWLEKGIPLPLGSIHNKRSLVAIDNLIDFIITCIDHPNANGETFLVSDGKDVSTTEMLAKIGAAFCRPARLLPMPAPLLKWLAKSLRKEPQAAKLLDSLQVDISKNAALLNWTPPYSMDEQLSKMV